MVNDCDLLQSERADSGVFPGQRDTCRAVRYPQIFECEVKGIYL